MELSDLNADERTAMVGLIKTVVFSDGKISESEREEVDDVVDAFGEDAYQKAMDSFESRFPDEKKFRTFLATIKRQEARELIYGTILEGAIADAIGGGESELLTWLATTWNVEVETEETPEDDLGSNEESDPDDR